MSQPTDEKRNEHMMEQFIGNMLRIGVMLSAAVCIIGGTLYVSHHAHAQRPDYSQFFKAPSWKFESMLRQPAVHSSDIIHLGIILLIATPILRVVCSIFAFLAKKDFLYVIFTLIVLAIIFFSMMERLG